MSSADNLSNSLELDQARQNVWPVLDPTVWHYFGIKFRKEFFEKVDSAGDKKAWKNKPSRQSVRGCYPGFLYERKIFLCYQFHTYVLTLAKLCSVPCLPKILKGPNSCNPIYHKVEQVNEMAAHTSLAQTTFFTKILHKWGCTKVQMSRDMRLPTMWYVRPAKPQISLRICAVWSEPLQVSWIFYDC